MKTIFPQTTTKNWIQQNKGDLYPVIYSTRNINLEKRGYIGLSRRMSYIKKDNGLSGVLNDFSVNTVQGKYKAFAGNGNTYDITYNLATTTQDTNVVNSGVLTYTEVYNDQIWYSSTGDSRVYYRALGSSGAYSSVLAGLTTTNYYHPMANFLTRNNLCVADGNKVITINNVYTVATGVTIPTNYIITSLKYYSGKLYIGAVSISGGSGALFVWSGSNDATNYETYEVNSRGVLSLEVYDQTIVCLTTKGELLRFSGGGFRQLATLPFFENKDYGWAVNSSNYLQTLAKSMLCIDDYLYIAISNMLVKDNTVNGLTEFPSGIYQYHQDFGLIHKFSPSQSTSSSITDFGQIFSNQPMSLFPLQEDSVTFASANSPTLLLGSRFIAGATLINPNLTASTYIQSITSGENRGEFTTSKIYTNEVTTVGQKVFVKYKNLVNNTDKIIVKYRAGNRQNLPFVLPSISTYSITWTNNTTFTSTNTQFSNVISGDEITVLSGNGAGSIAHISSITNNAGLYTIILDEIITGVVNGDMSGVAVDNWIKLGTILHTNTDGYQEFPIGINGKYIQLKIELRGENEPAIEEIILLDKGEILAK